MRTTIDIPEELLREIVTRTGARTKGRAIVAAVNAFNRRCRLAEMAGRLHGSCPNFMTQEDLKTMREDEKWEALSASESSIGAKYF